jgi:hypothetical protein
VVERGSEERIQEAAMEELKIIKRRNSDGTHTILRMEDLHEGDIFNCEGLSGLWVAESEPYDHVNSVHVQTKAIDARSLTFEELKAIHEEPGI